MIDIVATFIIFFAVIDPVGTIPVFIAVTNQYDDKARRKIALIATLVSAAILLFFVVAGELILTAMSVPLAAFQIAGGIVLFIFALSMIFGESKPEEELRIVEDHHDTAIYPLAVPSIAGPGAMLAAVLMTESAHFNLWQQAQTVGVMFSVLLVTYILMMASGHINKLIGSSGASVVSRVMGLVLSSVAAANTLSGIRLYFNL
ncbi:MAG: MarC family protein [Pseudomonadales bacterium]|nr:MarC family protein [Pseudomonadales bacterium]MCP5172194.1 MarC family protein [Pseudomonadales bacterium]